MEKILTEMVKKLIEDAYILEGLISALPPGSKREMWDIVRYSKVTKNTKILFRVLSN